MGINEIYDFYIGRMAEIHLYQSDMKGLTDSRLMELNKHEEHLLLDNDDTEFKNFSFNWLTARNPYTGMLEKVERSRRSVKDLKLSLLLHKNKHYQWLLAESYELFEDCLELLYAYAGHRNHDYWPQKYFEPIETSQLTGQEFGWFLEQAKIKQGSPASIINFFRNTYDIDKIENGFGVNLHLAIKLIENLRHVIVHLGGVVRDKELFTETILKKSGLHNSKEHLELINYYFGLNDYKNTIILFEKQVQTDAQLPMYRDEFREITSYLMGYIRILTDLMKQDCKLKDPH